MIRAFRDRLSSWEYQTVALLVSAFLVCGPEALLARQETPAPAPTPGAAPGAPEEAPKLSPEQLEALVAPIALYPDNLLAQCLVASTYPIDIVQAQQWADKHKDLKGEALSKEALKQDWDPSVQALTGIPDALKMLAQDIKWTTDLGDAFLAQQSEVMDAVQRMRAKAKGGGKLESSEQMKVETKVVEEKQVIVIEQSDPEVVVVPSYSPTVVYGAAPYPYPPLYYPPYYGGAWLGFGVGVAVGIGIAGGWGCGWGGNNEININNNNTFVNNSNRKNNISNSGNSKWNHNAQQRGGAPYKDKATANKYGGGARGDTARASSRSGAGAGGSRGGAGVSSMDAGRGGGGSFGGGAGGGGDRVGSRDMGGSSSFSGGGRSSSGFSGSGSSGRSASSASSRGSSSFSGSRGGGGYSGGGRGGGGGRRR